MTLLPDAYMLFALLSSITAAAALLFRLPDQVWALAIGTAIAAALTGVLLHAVIPTPGPSTAVYTVMEA